MDARREVLTTVLAAEDGLFCRFPTDGPAGAFKRRRLQTAVLIISVFK
jgi:hypothetical protein